LKRREIRTKILLYDHNPDVPSYPLSILGDPAASKYVDGTAFHLYGGETSVLAEVHDAHPKKNLYMTEQSVTGRRSQGPLGIAEPWKPAYLLAFLRFNRFACVAHFNPIEPNSEVNGHQAKPRPKLFCKRPNPEQLSLPRD
jgi:hypothetical protein